MRETEGNTAHTQKRPSRKGGKWMVEASPRTPKTGFADT